jgi:hypothetical protein
MRLSRWAAVAPGGWQMRGRDGADGQVLVATNELRQGGHMTVEFSGFASGASGNPGRCPAASELALALPAGNELQVAVAWEGVADPAAALEAVDTLLATMRLRMQKQQDGAPGSVAHSGLRCETHSARRHRPS